MNSLTKALFSLSLVAGLSGLTACGDACDDLLDLCKTCPEAIVAACQNVAYLGSVPACQDSLEANAAVCGGSDTSGDTGGETGGETGSDTGDTGSATE
jgi:hypothetical protein